MQGTWSLYQNVTEKGKKSIDTGTKTEVKL